MTMREEREQKTYVAFSYGKGNVRLKMRVVKYAGMDRDLHKMIALLKDAQNEILAYLTTEKKDGVSNEKGTEEQTPT